jgi:hypothetical protein
MLALIGEVCEPDVGGLGDMICGCVVNIRKGANKIAVWTMDADNETANQIIG